MSNPASPDVPVTLDLPIVIQQGEDGFLVGRLTHIPGCRSQGKTLEELKKNLLEALMTCVAEGDQAPSREPTQGSKIVRGVCGACERIDIPELEDGRLPRHQRENGDMCGNTDGYQAFGERRRRILAEQR